MFRRGAGTMVLTERMQALGDHARSSHQRLIAERRQESREQALEQERDERNHNQEIRNQEFRDQKNRAPEIFATDNGAASVRGETMMLEAAVLPPAAEAGPAEDAVIVETIETFLAVDEPAPEPSAPENDNVSAAEPAVAQSAGSRSGNAPGPAVARSATAPAQSTARERDLAARRAIIHEWQNWSALNADELADPNVGAYFFRHLETKRPRLLDFAADDKMQAVRGWLLSERCIKP